MKRKRINLVGTTTIIGFSILLIVSMVGFFSFNPQITLLDSGWKSNNITIDGKFTNSSEWQDASSIQISTVSILYFKNDNESLFLCLDAISDISNDEGDFFRIHFDTNNDDIWTPGEEDVFAYYTGLFKGGTHYVENSSGNPNEYISHCSFTCDSKLNGDTSFAISPNSIQNHQIYEIQIPFSIIDVNPGDQIGFFIYGGPFDAGNSEFNYYPNNGNPKFMNTWAKLNIAELGDSGINYIHFPYNNLFIILILISIIGIISGAFFIILYNYKSLFQKDNR